MNTKPPTKPVCRKLYVEVVTDRVVPGPRGIVCSTPRDATSADIKVARAAHRGKNPHDDEKTTVFYDEPGWMYDARICGICGQGIALI